MNRAQRRRLERGGDKLVVLPPRRAPRVMYAVIHGDYTDNAFTWSLRAVEGYDRIHGSGYINGYINMYSGPLLSQARNQVVENFLATDNEWLWCLDDDMVLVPDALERYMALADARERPIVSGLYFGGGKSALVTPHIFVVAKDEGGNLVTTKRTGFPWDEPFECDAVGAGCLLVHRSVLERMAEVMKPKTAYPWFAELEMPTVEGPKGVGEDVTFCIRARMCGFPIWVDPRVWLGHSKRYTIDRQVYEAQQAALEEVGESEIGRQHLAKLGVVV